MCYNEPISWVAFIIATVANIAVVYLGIANNILPIIAFGFAFQAVIMVQFFEALAWRGYDTLGANGVLLFTILQPVIIALALMYLPNDSWRKIIISVVIIAYLMYVVLSLNNAPKFDDLSESTDCPHLVYSYWSNYPMLSIPYLLSILLVLCLLLTTPLREIVVGYLALTLILSITLYPCAPGSLWCLSATGLPIILILILWLYPEMLIQPGGYIW
jgi:hypothetical protein